MSSLLSLTGVRVSYDAVPAVHEATIEVRPSEVVALVGANGAGKTSIMRAIAGAIGIDTGRIELDGVDIGRLPAHRRVAIGIAHVPEGRRLFGPLTAEENLRLGAFMERSESEVAVRLERVYDLFPILRERRKQQSGTLSGGEQQVLAIGRGLMSRPRLLLLDEPSLGVMPTVVDQIYQLARRLADEGVSVVVADQKLDKLLKLADRAYVFQSGNIILSGSGSELLASGRVREALLGRPAKTEGS